MEQYLRVKQVSAKSQISVASIWRLTKARKFPQPIKISERVTVWRASDIEAFISSKEAAA